MVGTSAGGREVPARELTCIAIHMCPSMDMYAHGAHTCGRGGVDVCFLQQHWSTRGSALPMEARGDLCLTKP